MSVLGLLAKGAKAKPLRSTLDEAVEALARPKGTGAEFLREIEKTKGVKPTEIKERGIDKVLANMPKVNKEEIVKAIQSKANPPIEEKILGGVLSPELQVTRDALQSKYKELVDNIADAKVQFEEGKISYAELRNIVSNNKIQTEALDSQINEINKSIGNTKYENYTLPNGNNYREILLKLPEKVKYDLEGFKSSHFSEPNILAHMRVSDRTGPNGEKVLHLEELQSDWHQQGREKGYQDKEAIVKAKQTFDDYTKDARERLRQIMLKEAEGEMKPERAIKFVDNYVNGMDDSSVSGILNEKPTFNELYRALRDSGGTGLPDAPFKKNWHEVALKKLINYATENGYDRLAITPGAEQAKRYDLSKQVDELLYKQNSDGTYQLSAQAQGRGNMMGDAIPPDKLENYVGKEVAQKIINNRGQERNLGGSGSVSQPKDVWGSLSGEGLQVGGEGMKGFYDKMLPDYLNKLGSPHGAQVKMHGMPSSPQLAGEFNNMLDHADLTPDMFKALPVEQQQKITSDWTQKTSPSLHTFDLTPSLKNEVTQKGLPLYQQIGIPLGGAEAVNLAQPEPEMKRGGSVSISSNPDTMFMELADKKMKGGGAEDDTKLTPSQWLKAQANKPTEPFTPIEDLTANLKAIANFPSKMYEGAKQLVTDPRAYFADMKAPTAEELAMAFNPAGVGMMGATKGIPKKFDRAPPLTKAEITKLLAETPELAHTVRGLYKAEAPELSGLIDKVQTPNRQSVIPMPNRWFTKPKENPHVQPLVEKVLQVNNMKREDFHSGAFVDPKTGLILDNQIHNDVGVAIDPITNRPVMTSGGVTGMESLPRDQGSFTNSNLLKQGKYKPTGGDSILNELGFIATVDKAGMGHAYGLGTDYASPVLLNNLGTGSNTTLRPRSVGDVFGVGDVVGQMQINKNSPVHDVYEKLLVAPKGSDVEGVKLSKAKGGAIRKMASGGAVQSLETNLPALTKTDYHSIDKLMAHISKEHKIPPQKLHDDFVAKHHMTPDTWIKRK